MLDVQVGLHVRYGIGYYFYVRTLDHSITYYTYYIILNIIPY